MTAGHQPAGAEGRTSTSSTRKGVGPVLALTVSGGSDREELLDYSAP